ncbi:MAG: LacI family transcriptional regulator [Gammaproteobacteria bacterium]|nr:MAG: LacI family transcriptional regulator [Gammaproteobacteria bacterium]
MSIVLLARELGLSISTVSRALNGYEDVSPATRQRILKRAKEIGYQPNPGARRLKSGKTSLVGVILPSAGDNVRFVDSVYSSLLGGVEVELEGAGYSLIATMQTRNDPVREAALYENFIRGRWVDALMIVRTRVNDARVELARKAHVPFVTYGRTASTEPHAWVDTDNERAFYLATLRQIEFGHERIALLNGPLEYNFARLRQQGYLRALAERGLPQDPLLMLNGDLSEVSGYALCRSLLVSAEHATAIVCATDAMAVGAIAACRERGIRVGKDVSIMGYGNSSASGFCDPPLTTVDHAVFDNGRHIGQSLLRLLRGAAKPADIHYLEPVVLVPRQSDGRKS